MIKMLIEKTDSRVGYALLVMFLFIVLSGCLRSPGDFEEVVINATPNVINNVECTCMVCTNSTGSFLLDIFTSNDLANGACDFVENCSRMFIYEFINGDKLNFVKDFGVGQGASYTEFEEANMRCNAHQEYVIRVLYSKYRPPLYDKSLFFNTKEANAIECALGKGVIPFYIIYTEGTYIESEWINDFMGEANMRGAMFIVPEALFNKSVISKIEAQVNAIYEKCKPESKDICTEWTKVNYGKITTRVCSKPHTVKMQGCRVALLPNQTNPIDGKRDEIFDVLDEINKTNKDIMDYEVSAIITLLNINEKDYKCDAGFALANAMNRSRYILNKYRKPSFLIISIDPSCKENTKQIIRTIYTSIEYMRMTGIFGMAYSQYFDFENNPLNMGQDAESIAGKNVESIAGQNAESIASAQGSTDPSGKMGEWLKLCKYYNDDPYKKEPIVFQSNGVNITNVCEYSSVHRMRAIDSTILDKYNASKIFPKKQPITGKPNYSLCIPEIDFGNLENVAERWSEFGNIEVYTTPDDCSYGYPEVEVNAERCSISRHLLRAFKKLGVEFNCTEWYETEKELNDSGLISYNNLKPGPELGKVAFMYVLKKGNEGYYKAILNREGIGDGDKKIVVKINELYLICEGGVQQSDEECKENDDTECHPQTLFKPYTLPCEVLKYYQQYKEKCNLDDLYDDIVGLKVQRKQDEGNTVK